MDIGLLINIIFIILTAILAAWAVKYFAKTTKENRVFFLEEIERIEKENTILRGKVAAQGPCVYCKKADMGQCPTGFPGCAKADDMFVYDELLTRRYRNLLVIINDLVSNIKLLKNIENLSAEEAEEVIKAIDAYLSKVEGRYRKEIDAVIKYMDKTGFDPLE